VGRKLAGQSGRPWSADTRAYSACHVLPVSAALRVTPSCGLWLPSFARHVAFFELLRQSFSPCLRLQPGMAIPPWAFSQCDGGHGAAAGCAQLLLLFAADRRCVFGARPQGIPESSSLSCPECGRPSSFQAVQFWPLGDKSSCICEVTRIALMISSPAQKFRLTIWDFPPGSWASS
jgi:hypothetical protein